MGGAFSSNVVNAIENVSNSIQTSSQATSNQKTTCLSSVHLNHCVISGNLEVQNICDVIATSNQILHQMTKSNLKSTIAQNLLQQAQSLVGAAGIGYASATNAANAFVNSYNAIINTVSAVSNQNALSVSQLDCNYSTINGNVMFGVTNSFNFLSQQMIQQQAVNDIVSNVTQTVSQTASATVEGLTGLIIALAILIVAIGYVLFRPVGMVLSNKFIMVTIITIVIAAILVTLFLLQAPPFFNPPTLCAPTAAGVGSCSGQDQCINPSKQSVAIVKPPLRYTYNIFGTGDVSLGQDPNNFTPGLLQLTISKFGGWTQQGFDNLQQYFSNPSLSATQAQPPPNPLVLNSSNQYVTNIPEWNIFVNQTGNVGRARFLLCKALEIDTTVYILPTEQCYVNGQVISPDPATCYQFIPSGPKPTDGGLINAIATGGSVTGMFGVCNTPTYRLQQFMKKGGVLIPIVLFIIIVLFLILYNRAPSSSAPTPSASEPAQEAK